MKLKNLFLAAAAAVCALSACEKNENSETGKPTISVTPLTLAFEASDAPSQTVKVTANYTWKAVANQDWIILGRETGSSSNDPQEVSVSVEDNTSYDRVGEITFSIGGFGQKIVVVNQAGPLGTYAPKEGDGSQASPFNVSQAFEQVKDLTWTDKDNYQKVGPYYVVGKVSSITQAFSSQYGNANFTISDDGTSAGAQLTAYRVNYLGNSKWKDGFPQIQIGDIAVVYGELMYYGTGQDGKARLLETVTGAYLYSQNGNTEVPEVTTPAEALNAPAATVAQFIAAADPNTFYKLTGTASSYSEQYGSFDLTDATGTIVVYEVNNAKSFNMGNGSTVTVAGKYKFYQKEGQEGKHEVVGAYILSAEGGDVPVESEPSGDGTLDNPYNAAMAKQVASQLASGALTETDVYVAGKIASIKYTFNATNGTATFDISDDGTTLVTTFNCYSVYYLGNRKWVEGDAQVAVGDDVVVYGKLTNYNGNTPETASKKACLYSLNGQTEIATSDVFSVASTSISVGASATSAQIKVTGNVAWTAASTAVTLDKTSGEGADTITASFEANTDTENTKSYSVTLSTTADVAEKEITVIITQGKALSGNAKELTIDLTKNTAFVAVNDETLKDGFIAEVEDFKVGTYQYKSTTKPITPDQYSIRIYKSAVFYIEAPEGKTITSLTFTANDLDNGKYCVDLTEIEPGTGTVAADKQALTIGPWTGSASKVILQAAAAQARLVSVTVVYE